MEFGKKKIRKIDSLDFTSFFGLDFLKFSGPLWGAILSRKDLVIIVGSDNWQSGAQWRKYYFLPISTIHILLYLWIHIFCIHQVILLSVDTITKIHRKTNLNKSNHYHFLERYNVNFAGKVLKFCFIQHHYIIYYYIFILFTRFFFNLFILILYVSYFWFHIR